MSRSLTAGDRAGADAETLRKASLKRALVAIVALMALTASLWLVEGSETAVLQALPTAPEPAEPQASEAVSASPAAPAVVETAPVVAEQGAPAETGQEPTGEARAVPPAAEPAGAMLAREASPPGWTAATVPVLPSISLAPAQAAEAPAAPVATSEVAPAEPAEPVEVSSRAAAPRLPAGPPPGPGYLIQLGVFLDTANAEGMRRDLERKGYPAHLQARVVLGPYPDRESAIAAQEKIRRERKLDGMILAPRK
ncbi:SPOR domain-containing protein [Aromatoleum toluclasticum]|uniref:SPOR domain-containing protein n=1 Tax=Aromatoleum toluclasticum TaxID=92003 RepID=UPI001D194A6C|nr:SPOR domain-containing protein [Aromatoleum toluclasticum]MCC4114161.1 SPOR domain-containing protein [Aromatoleum toluclasticum]